MTIPSLRSKEKAAEKAEKAEKAEADAKAKPKEATPEESFG